ncbi:hypothetical protein QTI27_35265 [Variovorax sp. J31P216]|nr:hypothetical protein [Variovorax sp. J31P216]
MATRNSSPKDAREICEAMLRSGRSERDASLLPREVKVIDRLLERGLELSGAYQELHSRLSDHPPALKAFLDQLLTIAAFWCPVAIQKARNGRARLIEINREIAGVPVATLAMLRCKSSSQGEASSAGNSSSPGLGGFRTGETRGIRGPN